VASLLLEEVPKDVLDALTIHLIKRVDEILPLVLEPPLANPADLPSLPPPPPDSSAETP
jgi:ATP-dependent Lon protease